MPWKEKTIVSQRLEFVTLALAEDADISQLCRRYGISRTAGYKWIHRFQEGGEEALQDRSRRPHTSPHRTSAVTEQAILRVRDAHPVWGGRKIRARLKKEGFPDLRSPSTITEVLRRHRRLEPKESAKHRPFKRFEMAKPNELWQIDFKGHFALEQGGRCHPLTILDDYSRFLVGLRACDREDRETVQAELTGIFRLYGLPERMLMDNGAPFGTGGHRRYSKLNAWMIRLGIEVSHGRPRHPQTQGKDERLHRTLKAELLNEQQLEDLQDSQSHFDLWRDMYNQERPHEALGMAVPSTRYQPSPTPFPESLPPIDYPLSDTIRQVDITGRISFRNRLFSVGKAFADQPVALRPIEIDGIFDVYFCQQKIDQISFREDNQA